MASKSLLMSMGTVNMWGFSPGFDMLHDAPAVKAASQEVLKKPAASEPRAAADESELEPINMLLIGPGDIRHALATIAHRRRRDTTRPLHIYIYEKSIEALARHFLLLQVAQDWQLPLRQRCNLFLEVFGNARVQVRSSLHASQATCSGLRIDVMVSMWLVLGAHECVLGRKSQDPDRPAAQRARAPGRPLRPFAPKDAPPRRARRHVQELVRNSTLRWSVDMLTQCRLSMETWCVTVPTGCVCVLL